MLHRIYVIRHGETADIAQDEKGTGIDPTGNFADIVLSETGREQAKQTAKRLALENLPIDVVYSAPSYQCLETLRPFVTDAKGATVHQVRVENGLGDSQDIDDLYPLCNQQCYLKRPTDIATLQQHFPYIHPNYKPIVTIPAGGWRCEPPRRLLLRAHFTIDHIIKELDRERLPQTVLLCTHAPLLLALSRVLTSTKLPQYIDFDPEYRSFFGALRRRIRYIAMVEFSEPDHHAGHCCITRFDRRNAVSWAWSLSINGDQTHLSVPSGAIRFRPTPWQNRHTPHPVLAALSFFRALPGSLLWIPTAIINKIVGTVGELATALRRQLRNNPYRLPAWVYIMLWTCLVCAVCNRLIALNAASEEWAVAEGAERTGRRVNWLEAFANSCASVIQFSLFMFPPLLA